MIMYVLKFLTKKFQAQTLDVKGFRGPGKSKWKNQKDLNETSIGIELENKGHKNGYQNFTKIQINRLIKLCKKLKKIIKLRMRIF